jgi:hypothetical protein
MQGQTSSYTLTTLIAPPSSFWLTTLADVKDELGITTGEQDTRLGRYIAGESANIARYCNRVFGLATWQDEFRPQHGVRGEGVRAAINPLTLAKWPLAAPAVSFTGNTHLSQIVDGLSSVSGLYQGMPVFGTGIPAGATIATVMAPFAILLSVPATVVANTVALTGGMSVIETVAGTSTTLIADTDFQIDRGSLLPGDEGVGALYRLNQQGNPRTWPAAQIVVIYQAGYALPGVTPACNQTPALPSDLQDTCLQIVVGRYFARDRDPLLKSFDQPNLGRKEYWVGASPGQIGPYPNEIMAVLDRYRVPITAAA